MGLPPDNEPILDALGKLIIELREVPAVAALIGDRVRGFEPAPPVVDPVTKRVIRQGDARGPGEYLRFIVLSTLATPRLPGFRRAPVQVPRVAARLYGLTPQDAMALYGVVAAAVHGAGPRVHANGLGIYQSWDDTGATPDKDPATGQPLVHCIFELLATTQVSAQ